MKIPACLLMSTLLATGCANFPNLPDIPNSPAFPDTFDNSADTDSADRPNIRADISGDDRPAGTTKQQCNILHLRDVRPGNWRVDCVFDEVTQLTQCKAETYSTIAGYVREDSCHPPPTLWISWLKGDPKHTRSVCVFGHDYPVTSVSLQIDNNAPLQIDGHHAAGCMDADSTLINQLRTGDELAVTFERWPWGQTTASFRLDRSTYILKKLDRLVALQWSRWKLFGM